MYLPHVTSPAVILIVLHVCVISIPSAHAIKCFQCNSRNESSCETLSEPMANGKLMMPQECVGDYGPNKPFCRKTVLGILVEKETQNRVVRTCGWMKYKNPCYTANNDDHTERSCQCFEDGCNSAAGAVPLLLTLALASLAPFLITR